MMEKMYDMEFQSLGSEMNGIVLLCKLYCTKNEMGRRGFELQQARSISRLASTNALVPIKLFVVTFRWV